MKRAQVEIIGLLIIVVIISIVMLYAIKYLLEGPEDHLTGYTHKDLSSSMVGAILNTHSNCTKDTLFNSLLIDCAKYPPDGSHDLICDNGLGSCDYASQAIDSILDSTLDEWKYPYEFKVLTPSKQSISKLNFNSTGLEYTGSVSTFSQPLTVDTSGYATMQILLCIGGPCP